MDSGNDHETPFLGDKVDIRSNSYFNAMRSVEVADDCPRAELSTKSSDMHKAESSKSADLSKATNKNFEVVNPEDYSFIGRMMFTWNFPVLWRGWSNPITADNLPKLRDHLDSHRVGMQAAKLWKEELEKKKPNLSSTMGRLLRKQLVTGSIMGAIDGLLTCVARPLVLRRLVQALEEPGTIPDDEAISVVVGVAAVVFIEAWLGVVSRHKMIEDMGTAYIAGMFHLMLDKIASSPSVTINGLHASKSSTVPTNNSKEAESVGTASKSEVDGVEKAESEELSMFGNDLIRSYNQMMFASGYSLAISGIVGGVAVTIYIVGVVSAVIGLSVAAIIIVANMWLTRIGGKIEHVQLELADLRINILNQIIESAKFIKFFVWEEEYIRKISVVRTDETRAIRKGRITHATSVALGRSSPVLAAAVSILSFRFIMGNTLTTGDAFAVVTLFQSMRLPLIMAPMALGAIQNFAVSLSRLKKYLLKPNHTLVNRKLKSDSTYAMKINDMSIGWNGKFEPYVVNINLSMASYERTAIIGPVGSGKSLLLQGIIGELSPAVGSIEVSAAPEQVGYVPQSAIIVSGSVKENILFGRPLHEDRLSRALNASAFVDDLARMPQGVDTEIGERGTTLSGGQQQRLSIARALYNSPNLLVMDDPLSAVDAIVCDTIFKRAVLTREKATIMVLNQLHLLQHFENILFLVDGKVIFQGTYDGLQNNTEYQEWSSTAEAKDKTVVKEPTKSDLGVHVDDVAQPSSSQDLNSSEDESDSENFIVSRRPTMIPSVYDEADNFVDNNRPTISPSIDGEDDDNFIVSSRRTIIPSIDDDIKTDKTVAKVEEMKVGRVSFDVVKQYIRSMGTFYYSFTAVMILTSYGLMAFSDVILGRWIRDSEAEVSGELATSEDLRYALLYGVSTLLMVIGVLLGSYRFCWGGERVSNSIHSEMITKLLFAPYQWLLETPSGRIMSRFSSDMGTVDLFLTFWVDNFHQLGSSLLVLVIVVSVLVPPVIVLEVLCIGCFVVMVEATDRCNRQMKRISNNAMGPILSNVQEAIHGRVLTRAMGLTTYFSKRHEKFVNDFNTPNFASWTLMSWIQLYAALISGIVSVVVAAWGVFAKDESTNTDTIAIAVMYSFLVPYYLAFVAQICAMVWMYFTSFERIMEYRNLPQEPPHNLPSDPPGWPNKGEIRFQHASMRYRSGLDFAVRDLNIRIPPGAKVGVVGRTGAGKSSLAAMLFRLVECSEGQILIDDVEISKVGLQQLRDAITVIPQDPLLMEGSISQNLDPFNSWSSVDIEHALRKASLDASMASKKVSKGGGNLSAGERQLICFARALLYKAKILILDEPTASVDLPTDRKVQAMVRKEFAGVTLLCIAHRLNTIIDYDLILVMDKGNAVEYGTPAELLTKDSGALKNLVSSLSRDAQITLYEKAGVDTSDI